MKTQTNFIASLVRHLQSSQTVYCSVTSSVSLWKVCCLTNQNSIAEEIKNRLKSRNACYHSVQNILSSRLLSKNLKIKICRTVVLYGCETWSLTLREERKLRVFENRVLRIFGPRRDEVTREWRRLHNEELNELYSSPNIVRVINREEWDGLGMWPVWVRRGGV